VSRRGAAVVRVDSLCDETPDSRASTTVTVPRLPAQRPDFRYQRDHLRSQLGVPAIIIIIIIIIIIGLITH